METTDAFTGLSCVGCGGTFDPETATHQCPDCGGILDPAYDLDRVDLSPEDLAERPFESMWRYGELLPFAPEAAVSLGEGATPLVECPALADAMGVGRVLLKDEGANPTGTFKDRGQSLAMTAARQHGAADIALNSAGNAGQAAAARTRPVRIWTRTCTSRRGRVHPKGDDRGPRRRSHRDGSDRRQLADRRRRAGVRRRDGRTPRLVLGKDVRDAVPPRGKEDDGVRAARTARLGERPTASSTPPAGASASWGCTRPPTRFGSWDGPTNSSRCTPRRRRAVHPSSTHTRREPTATSRFPTTRSTRPATGSRSRTRERARSSSTRSGSLRVARWRRPTARSSTPRSKSLGRRGWRSARPARPASRGVRAGGVGEFGPDDTVVLLNTGAGNKDVDALRAHLGEREVEAEATNDGGAP